MKKKRFVKDCIYRFVDIDDFFTAFIDTPEFQRLRHIKQLGFDYLVYPSAVHTRFEHSLGVMHLTSLIIQVLRNFVEISEREEQLVKLAALYHDIGHAAFSHFFHSEDHEIRSILILKQVNQRLKLLTETEIEQVGDMILGQYQDKGDKSFLYEIVNNEKGIDTDRMDYLARDAYHTGMHSFQSDYIIKCAMVKDGRLCWQEKAKPEIERMYETRTRMFEVVYRHKTVLKIEQIIRYILKKYEIEIDPFTDDDNDVMVKIKKYPEYQWIITRQWINE